MDISQTFKYQNLSITYSSKPSYNCFSYPLNYFENFLTKIRSCCDVKSVISCQIIILYVSFVVKTNSRVQTFISDLLSLPPRVFTSSDQLRGITLQPTINTPFLRHWRVNMFRTLLEDQRNRDFQEKACSCRA